MTQTRGGLGRGLSALLPQGVRPSGPHLRELALDEIVRNPKQPRTAFDDGQLAELAASIEQIGLLQPIVVRPAGDRYEIVAGERRWRAARLAGLERVPALVRETGDDQLLRDALIENIQRVDLNPLEEAAAYRQLVDDLGATHEEIAERVGKNRVTITNALRLLQLAPSVQARIAAGVLTAAHGRAIAALADHSTQERIAQRAVAEGMSARETEDLVRTLSAGGQVRLAERALARRRAADRPAGILEAEALLSDILATTVTVEARRRRGRIVIEFAGDEDLARIVSAIASQNGQMER